MDLKATIRSGYRTRLLIIATATLLYSGWCLYDAILAYPDKVDAREAFDDLKDKKPQTWDDEWPRLAELNGWDPTGEPQEISAWNIKTQWIQFAIVFPIGSYCLISLGLWSRRYLGADDDKLYAHGGDEIPYDAITRVDAPRWESKGIALVYYDIGGGEKSLLIDDWKYEREPSDAIFDRIREKIDDSKIIGMSDEEEDAEAADATA